MLRRLGLTPREAVVATHVLAGGRSPDIARRLGCRPETARVHLHRVFDKLGVSSRRDLAGRLLAAR